MTDSSFVIEPLTPAIGAAGHGIDLGRALHAAARARLANDGWRVVEAPMLGQVNAIRCPRGNVVEPSTCVYRNDRRGFGYAVSAVR